MKMRHLLIEGYCDGNKMERMTPCKGNLQMGTHCFTCSKFSYSGCPNEIALSNADGVVETQEDFIGFGGDMEPEIAADRANSINLWNKICRNKIAEAYEIYMKNV